MKDTSRPRRNSSMRTRLPGGAELLLDHHLRDRLFGLLGVVADDDALAGGQAVGLDDDREAELAGA